MNIFRRRNVSPEPEENPLQLAKLRKPPNTAFRQQRLKAWQPILTPKTVIPLLFLLAAIFAPLGIALIYGTYNVQNLIVDYTHCDQLSGSGYESIPGKYTNWHFRHKNSNPDFKWKFENTTEDGEVLQKCLLQFNLPHDLPAPIYMYYKLTNFYQNHRKYVSSYDLAQLGGTAVSADDVTLNCDPLTTRDGKPVYPCGLVANSVFNDTFGNPVLLNAKLGSDNETYELTQSGISWSSDRKHKFKKTKYSPDDVVPPPNWAKTYPDGYTSENMPDLSQMEHLQNWMRTAGLPTFYKLYAQNKTATFSSGTYELAIGMNYPVSMYGGTKSLVLTTNNVLGGRNMSLGIIYFIVAVFCLVCALAFFLQYLIKPRRMGEHNFLQDNTRDVPTNPLRDQL
ncbi:LEM3 (ligand-effect modulator 3) family / CDC50 family protein [Metschnikowia aff. pulcherrima]|uniref:LEM3 (Ligand-effect modulator 3) family / CDC50 family protein n=1 Tax=Metschnikowia aff. pulcherrima TaxID=2163413 RepID=A0A4P6XVU6_9ASCO|nr:LEM3 (ligand-effect modulator 3) family / CDC50 family protein [Metschnikowia aff. pulcherrima]